MTERGRHTSVMTRVADTRACNGVNDRWSRGVWPLPDPDEEEVLSEDEEWMDSEEAKFVRCDTNVGCHYVNGRVQAEDDETVRDLARRYNLEDVKLAYLNKMEHPTISPTSKLVRGTLLLLPLHPTLAQRLPEHALDAVVYPPLPHLASSGQEDGEENLSRGSTFEFVQVRGRMGTRHATRVPQRLYGGMAVRAGACEELLGARVVVECVNSRLLGTVACYDAAKSQYHILLDAHGGSGGLGDVVVEQVVVTTPLPCPDVHVVAAMPRCNIRACSPEEDHALEQKAASGGSRMGLVVVAAAESSPETPPLHAPPAPEPDSMGGGAVADGIGAAQLAALVGMTVTRGFDGVSGKVSTLVPGSDVVIIEWEDGDCEDMHVTDMQRQGLL